MKITKKISMGGAFARKKAYEYEGNKYEADLKDQDIVTINNEGENTVGEYGDQLVFKIETRNGEKNLSLNQTSQNNLVDAFGAESSGWVGKKVKVHTLNGLVSGKMRTMVYLAHIDSTMEVDDDGNILFTGGEKAEVTQPTKETIEYPEDEPNPEDIPF